VAAEGIVFVAAAVVQMVGQVHTGQGILGGSGGQLARHTCTLDLEDIGQAVEDMQSPEMADSS
jgi:hypothetical protein